MSQTMAARENNLGVSLGDARPHPAAEARTCSRHRSVRTIAPDGGRSVSPNLPHADRWAPPPVRNLILGRLRPIEVRRLEPHLELVRLQAGQVLAEPGTALQRVWFPATCVLSLYVLMGGGDTATVGLIGREGTAGYAAAFGGRRSHARLVVQVPGDALVLPARVVLATLASSATFRQSMLQYAEALHAQALQLAACSALHGAEERLASLLLSLDDRIEPGIVLPLTYGTLHPATRRIQPRPTWRSTPAGSPGTASTSSPPSFPEQIAAAQRSRGPE